MKIFTVQTESYGSIMERGKNGIVIGSNYEPVTVLEELEEVPSLEGTLLVLQKGCGSSWQFAVMSFPPKFIQDFLIVGVAQANPR